MKLEFSQGRLIAFFGYAYMAALFAFAFFDLRAMDYFLLKAAIVVYMVEFISLHSFFFTVALTKEEMDAKKAGVITLLYACYSMFVGAIGFATNSGILPLLYFWFSSALKILEFRSDKDPSFLTSRYILSFVVFLLVSFAAVFLQDIICSPSWNSVAEEAGIKASNVFMDCPYVLGMWGILYFAIMAIIEFIPGEIIKRFVPSKGFTAPIVKDINN